MLKFEIHRKLTDSKIMGIKMLDKGVEYIKIDDGLEYKEVDSDILCKKSVKLFAIDKPSKQMVAKIQQKRKQKCYEYLKKKR